MQLSLSFVILFFIKVDTRINLSSCVFYDDDNVEEVISVLMLF